MLQPVCKEHNICFQVKGGSIGPGRGAKIYAQVAEIFPIDTFSKDNLRSLYCEVCPAPFVACTAIQLSPEVVNCFAISAEPLSQSTLVWQHGVRPADVLAISMQIIMMIRRADCQTGMPVQMKEAKTALAKEGRQESVPPHAEPSQQRNEILSFQPETLHAASSAAQSSQMKPSLALAQPPSAAAQQQAHRQQPAPPAAAADHQPAPVHIQPGQPIIQLSRTAYPTALPKTPSPPAKANQLGLPASQPQPSAMATSAVVHAGQSLQAQFGFTGIARPMASQPAGTTQIELSQRSEAEHAADLQAAIDKAATEGADKSALLQSVGSVRKGTAKAIVNEVHHWRMS